MATGRVRGNAPRSLPIATFFYFCFVLTAWTILQNGGPNHLGLRCNAFPEHQMPPITSDCRWFEGSEGETAAVEEFLTLAQAR